jgi:hypothetical protein
MRLALVPRPLHLLEQQPELGMRLGPGLRLLHRQARRLVLEMPLL